MARTYGFRIFVITAHPNRKNNPSLDASSTSTVRDEVLGALTSLNISGTRFLTPSTPTKPGEPARPTSSITVGVPFVVRQDLIHVNVATGETGSHSKATKQGKKPKDLEAWSPEATHFVALLFPNGPDDRFIAVVETIRRRDPMRMLIRHLQDQSRADRDAARAAEKAVRSELRSKKLPLPKASVFQRLVFDYKQAADNGYLDEILGAADSVTATFKSSAPSGRGSRSDMVERTLQIKLLDQNAREIGRDVGKGWAGKKRQGGSTSKHDGVSELAEKLEDSDLLSDGEGARYDSASINVRNKAGDSTTIAVDTLRDVFTYPVSDGAPPVSFFYDRVSPRLSKVAAEERIEVNDIDSAEVEDCLSV